MCMQHSGHHFVTIYLYYAQVNSIITIYKACCPLLNALIPPALKTCCSKFLLSYGPYAGSEMSEIFK